MSADLFFEHFLVLADVAEQLGVEEDDEEHGDAVGVDEDSAHEGARALVLGQEVEGAGGQVALCNRQICLDKMYRISGGVEVYNIHTHIPAYITCRFIVIKVGKEKKT